MAQRFEIVFDSLVPSALARFWAGALAGYAVRAYDEEELARLSSRGLTPETDTAVAVDGAGPTLWFQQSDRATTARNRIHFDIVGVERDAEVERLRRLGATVRDEQDTHTVMLDPEGNQFCVFD